MPRAKPAEPEHIRQQGTGSVFWNAKKQRYQATITLGYKPNGQRNRKTYTARAIGETQDAKDEVTAWLSKATADLITGTLLPPSRETVRGFLEQWADTKAEMKWGERHTLETKAKLVRYVYPVIGTVRLNDLTAQHIQRVYAGMRRTTSKRTHRALGAQTIHHVHAVLHAALGPRVNWREVEAPAVKRFKERMPDAAEVSAAMTAAVGTRYGPYWVLMGTMALRPQEVLAIRRNDLDWKAGTIRIDEGMITKGTPRFKEPKTEESGRTLPAPPEVMALLRSYCDQYGALQLQAGGLVFCTDAGGPLPIWWLYPVWRKLLTGLDIPYFRPYALRHFSASYWIDEGIPITEIAAALGHSTPATTHRIYAHFLKGKESRTAAAGGRLLRLKTDGAEQLG